LVQVWKPLVDGLANHIIGLVDRDTIMGRIEKAKVGF